MSVQMYICFCASEVLKVVMRIVEQQLKPSFKKHILKLGKKKATQTTFYKKTSFSHLYWFDS